jgi:hypothetical protein
MKFIPWKGVDIDQDTRLRWAKEIERNLLRTGERMTFIRSGNRLVLGIMDDDDYMEFFDCIVTGTAILNNEGEQVDEN